jgi:hypothetical protein
MDPTGYVLAQTTQPLPRNEQLTTSPLSGSSDWIISRYYAPAILDEAKGRSGTVE